MQSQYVCPPHARKYVLATAILASALGFIDGSVVAIAVPQMRASLDASFAEIQWVSNAYVLFLASLMLIGGAAGDRFGLKRVFGFGIALFVLASQLCAIAWSVESLIAFRALQGAGAAIMVPGSMAIIGRNFPKSERGRAFGIWVAASSVTTSMGPLVGGLLLTWGGPEIWRMIFAINLPLGGIALFLMWWFVPSDPPRDRKPLDILGGVMVTLSLGAIAAGLTILGEGDGGPQPVALLFGGAVLLVLAIIWERRVTHPMIDLDLFRSREFSGANVLTFLVWTGLGAVLFFLPMVLVTAWGKNELLAAGAFLPFSIMITVLSPFAGQWTDRLGARPFLTFGPLVAALGFVLLALAVWYEKYLTGVVPAMLVIGVSFGLMASPLSAAVMGSVDEDKTGAASGINNMAARMSNLFAVAGLGILLALIYRAIVWQSDLAGGAKTALIDAGFGEVLVGTMAVAPVQAVQTQAMNLAFAGLCLVVAVLCIAGSLVGWFTQPRHTEDTPTLSEVPIPR